MRDAEAASRKSREGVRGLAVCSLVTSVVSEGKGTASKVSRTREGGSRGSASAQASAEAPNWRA